MQPRGGVCERSLRICQRLQQLVLDADRVRRAPRLLGVVGCDKSDSLAPIPHHVRGEDRLIWDLESVSVAAWYVHMGEHSLHAWHGFRLAGVDRDDAGVGVRAAHCRAPEHGVHLEIG